MNQSVANVVGSSLIILTIMMEPIGSQKRQFLQEPHCVIPKHANLHSNMNILFHSLFSWMYLIRLDGH
jgi:hypothetical protein